jgi:hypothetical protein
MPPLREPLRGCQLRVLLSAAVLRGLLRGCQSLVYRPALLLLVLLLLPWSLPVLSARWRTVSQLLQARL